MPRVAERSTLLRRAGVLAALLSLTVGVGGALCCPPAPAAMPCHAAAAPVQWLGAMCCSTAAHAPPAMLAADAPRFAAEVGEAVGSPWTAAETVSTALSQASAGESPAHSPPSLRIPLRI